MKAVLSRVKEYGKKIENVALWGFAISFALLGLILLFSKTWIGILLILSGCSLVPVLKKWIPVKTWQQVVTCLVLLLVTVICSPKTVSTPDGTDFQSTKVPASPSTSSNQVLTVKFDAGEYSGTLSENKPSGIGTLTYSNLGTYKGSFKDGKRNGIGTFTWKNGCIYSGQWKDDKINGNGAITFNKSSKLTAVFDNSTITSGDYNWTDSKGTYKMHVDNTKSKPEYSLDAKYSNGINYKGSFAEGNLNGQGTMTYPKAGTYTGEFVNGKKSGEGGFIWNDGDKFSGTWVNDQMNGEGLYIFADGSILSGPFISNIPQGTLTYIKQGTSYKTVWSNGKCNSIKKE